MAIRVDREIFDAVGAGAELGGLRFYEDGTRQAPWQPRPFMSQTEYIVSNAMRLMQVPADVIRQQIPQTALTNPFPDQMGYGPQVALTIEDVLETDRWAPQFRSWSSGTVRKPRRVDYEEDMWSSTVGGFNSSPNIVDERKNMRAFRYAAIAVLALAGITACGDDDDDAVATTTGTVAVAASVPGSNIVTVVATDYKFSELPAEVPAGTKFALQNDSTAEAHEMIVIRIPDGETRTIGQLAALPEAESDAVFGTTEPATVIVALPGETGTAVEGDGTVTEPGRYAVVCFIPKGAPVDVLREALNASVPPTGPPDMGTGAPHITQGMYAEVVVK